MSTTENLVSHAKRNLYADMLDLFDTGVKWMQGDETIFEYEDSEGAELDTPKLQEACLFGAADYLWRQRGPYNHDLWSALDPLAEAIKHLDPQWWDGYVDDYDGFADTPDNESIVTAWNDRTGREWVEIRRAIEKARDRVAAEVQA